LEGENITMTTQEAYERMRAYFSRPGAKRAVTINPDAEDDPMCCYRTPEGDACAAGCLIPDEVYDPVIEQSSISEVMRGTVPLRVEGAWTEKKVAVPQIAAALEGIDRRFLDEAQHLHDRSTVSCYDENGNYVETPNTVETFIRDLDKWADECGLDVPEKVQ